MTILLPFAIVTIVSALVSYTIAVWSEKFAGRLKPWHALLFWIGLVFDTTGTVLMTGIAGRLDFNLHGITGALAILLMLVNAVWATIVLVTRNEKQIQNFHKFSLFVWLIWLVSFITGMLGAMAR
jgi:uncharacterized repeat protein (TIGR03987 family)